MRTMLIDETKRMDRDQLVEGDDIMNGTSIHKSWAGSRWKNGAKIQVGDLRFLWQRYPRGEYFYFCKPN